jgi:hypothetical protein
MTWTVLKVRASIFYNGMAMMMCWYLAHILPRQPLAGLYRTRAVGVSKWIRQAERER